MSSAAISELRPDRWFGKWGSCFLLEWGIFCAPFLLWGAGPEQLPRQRLCGSRTVLMLPWAESDCAEAGWLAGRVWNVCGAAGAGCSRRGVWLRRAVALGTAALQCVLREQTSRCDRCTRPRSKQRAVVVAWDRRLLVAGNSKECIQYPLEQGGRADPGVSRQEVFGGLGSDD